MISVHDEGRAAPDGLEERAAGVVFQPGELVDQRGLVHAEVCRGGVDGGVGHGGLEPLQPQPAVQPAEPVGEVERALSGAPVARPIGGLALLLTALRGLFKSLFRRTA